MSATRGRAAFLRQIQRGFILTGFLFVFGGVGGFLFLFVEHAKVDRLVPVLLVTAILEGAGMLAIAMMLEIIFLLSSRWLRERRHGK